MKIQCPWCGGLLAEEHGKFIKCYHCMEFIHWGDGKPFKTEFEARNAEDKSKRVEPSTNILHKRIVDRDFEDLLELLPENKDSELLELLPRLDLFDRLLLYITRIFNPAQDQEFQVKKFLSLRRKFRASVEVENPTRKLFFWRSIILCTILIILLLVAFVRTRDETNTTPSSNKITFLTKDLAQQLIKAKEDELDISKVTSLNSAVAKKLAEWDGHSIRLSGLRNIDPTTAEELSKWRGATLDLSGIKDLSEESALALSNWSGNILRLNGVQTLSTNVAKILAKVEETSIELLGLVSINNDIFLILKTNDRIKLGEFSVELPPQPTMPEVVHKTSDTLSANTENIESITVSQAKYLIEYHLYYLRLDGLASITKEVAQELAKYRGLELSLNGLTSIDKETAEALAESEATSLKLAGLRSIDRDTFLILSRNSRISLSPMPALALDDRSDAIPPNAGEVDQDFKDEISLYGKNPLFGSLSFEFLSPKQAVFLVKNYTDPRQFDAAEKTLRLDNLISINKEVVDLLMTFDGNITLCGLTSINTDVARSLANFKGQFIKLKGLSLIDEEIIFILQSNPAIDLPEKNRD